MRTQGPPHRCSPSHRTVGVTTTIPEAEARAPSSVTRTHTEPVIKMQEGGDLPSPAPRGHAHLLLRHGPCSPACPPEGVRCATRRALPALPTPLPPPQPSPPVRGAPLGRKALPSSRGSASPCCSGHWTACHRWQS